MNNSFLFCFLAFVVACTSAIADPARSSGILTVHFADATSAELTLEPVPVLEAGAVTLIPGERIFVKFEMDEEGRLAASELAEASGENVVELKFSNLKLEGGGVLMLKVSHPFDSYLHYRCQTRSADAQELAGHPVNPVYPGIKGFESFEGHEVMLVLDQFELRDTWEIAVVE